MRAFPHAFALLCLLAPLALISASAAEAETRTLKLYYIHTKERAEITFKKDGKYVQSGLNKLNRFLRDWRRNEPTKMDPQLFDIVWEAYQMAGARDYIHVVSAYRSPATNEMLRRTRGGQASKSQHMYGKAMDFYIPGVKLSKLREIGFKLQGGGVGYYPKSGSPFVHFDTGSVRAWPRMSRAELNKVFPNGGTLHLPPDGKPLPGYQQALAAYKSRKAKGQATAVTSGGRSSGGGGLIAGLFGGGIRDEETVQAPAAAPRPPSVVRAQPERPRETPATLMAALAPRATPLPQFAPRSAPIEAVEAVEADDVPLPSNRPEILLASTSPDAGLPRRSAEDIEAALDNDSPQSPAEDEVEKLIASARETDIVKRAMQIPLPQAAPRPERMAGPKVEVASLPNPEPRPAETASAFAQIPVPGERAATEARPMAPSYDTGVETTERAPRPNPYTASINRPASELVPADMIDPSRFGTWTTAQLSLTDYGQFVERPIFARNALREAPTTVYTQGFTRQSAPDPNRFSGKAVNFLTVAKFEGGKGGDGMPLTLSIPPTN
ncbi:DUF882 domain-containing protein [Oricola sp.]|uniref:DUF882 domain-containing protein n=1 Tax=Oricola sp. TaxID=1979950 RepID=UPI0025E93DE0|nr:DUF882 domain-containing protein [Oricola sp.]MCI5074686.1 DUF882 domain-containing protein [Oricola sp.]